MEYVIGKSKNLQTKLLVKWVQIILKNVETWKKLNQIDDIIHQKENEAKELAKGAKELAKQTFNQISEMLNLNSDGSDSLF
uniref:Uncharacterized protein n=1 Tax=Acrobeloides nanus TaxID=290746 RepID=A0A914CTV9_9BILA